VFSKKRTHSTTEEPKKQSPPKKQKLPEQNEKLIRDTEELHAKFDSGDFGTKKFEKKAPTKNNDFLGEKKKALSFKDEFKAQAGKLLSRGMFGNTKSSYLVSNDPTMKNIKKGYDPYRAIHPIHENNPKSLEKTAVPSKTYRKNKTPKLLSRQLFYNSDDEEDTKVHNEIESARIKEMKKMKEGVKKPKLIDQDDNHSSDILTIKQLCKILAPMVESVKLEFDDVNEIYEINNGWFQHTAALSGHIENVTHFTFSQLLDG
jgi:hypothetical protein